MAMGTGHQRVSPEPFYANKLVMNERANEQADSGTPSGSSKEIYTKGTLAQRLQPE